MGVDVVRRVRRAVVVGEAGRVHVPDDEGGQPVRVVLGHGLRDHHGLRLTVLEERPGAALVLGGLEVGRGEHELLAGAALLQPRPRDVAVVVAADVREELRPGLQLGHAGGVVEDAVAVGGALVLVLAMVRGLGLHAVVARVVGQRPVPAERVAQVLELRQVDLVAVAVLQPALTGLLDADDVEVLSVDARGDRVAAPAPVELVRLAVEALVAGDVVAGDAELGAAPGRRRHPRLGGRGAHLDDLGVSAELLPGGLGRPDLHVVRRVRLEPRHGDGRLRGLHVVGLGHLRRRRVLDPVAAGFRDLRPGHRDR